MENLFKLAASDPPFIPGPIINVMARKRIQNYALEQRIFQEIKADTVEQRVTGLTTPTLIVWGSEDKIISVEAAKILSNLMPNSQVIIMQNIGHAPMFENPEQAAQDYLGFRASLE